MGTLKIFKVPWCVGYKLCVWTLEIFKVLWYVGSVVCRDFEDFHNSLVCGALKIFKVLLCVDSVVWCVGTLKFFKVPLCVRFCPCAGEIGFFRSKSPVVAQ